MKEDAVRVTGTNLKILDSSQVQENKDFWTEAYEGRKSMLEFVAQHGPDDHALKTKSSAEADTKYLVPQVP